MKKKNFAKVIVLLLAAGMAAMLFAACAKKPAANAAGEPQGPAAQTAQTPKPEPAAKPAPKPEPKPVTLNFWHHYSSESPENETLMKVLIPRFEKEHPEYKINAVSHEWGDLHDKILISASSKTLPDVARLDIAWVPEFQKIGILAPLNKEMKDFEEVSSNLLPSAMSTGYVKGDYYALALNTNTKILFYNKQALAEKNIALPKTYDEFLSAIAALSYTNKDGKRVWGLNEPALAGWNILPYIWSNGGDITNGNYTKATGYINSPETVEVLKTLADLYKNGQFIGFNSGDIPMTDGFGTGRYMMLLEGPWKTAEMAGAYPDFQYGTSEMPAGKAGSISVLGGEDIAMFNSANKEGAWEFMKFMTSEFAQEEMAKCGQIPVNKTALESSVVKNSAFVPFLEAIKTAKARPTVATWNEIDSELTSAATDIIVNGADAQSVLDELAAKVDKLLAQ